MNLIEAVKYGKRFKRKSSNEWLVFWQDIPPVFDPHVKLTMSDILADDWEYEERKKLVGREEYNKAWETALEMSRNSLSIDLHGFRDRLMQLLGIR